MSKRFAFYAFTVSCCLASLLSFGQARAWWNRHYAYDCVSATDHSGNGRLMGASHGAWFYSGVMIPLSGIGSHEGRNRTLQLYCPVVDESSSPKTDLLTLNVSVYDGDSSDRVCAMPCIQDLVRGTRCGDEVCSGTSDTFRGNAVLQLGSIARALFREYPESFGYIEVSVPAGASDPYVAGYHPSVMRGYYQSN
jgi:hypothetical protein